MGVDFYAPFSPMSSLITARTLMALAVHHNLPIAPGHADIPQAFVQSVLKRPIYCKFPQGVEICPKLLAHVQAKHPNARIGMKLLKSLYGLKNAPMYWSLLLNQHLTGLGFIRSKSDTSLYTYIGPDGEWCAIAVFVDDLLITGTSTAKIDELRTYLDRTFKGEGAWDECVIHS